ncbi:terminase gpA endonuclease subunit, partial [Escherichia coli]|uniref:terminase gpA endonuclease subunit n=1 Tax=Escherichia coli TaxID=562 RepID=UPI00201B1319
EPVPSRSVPDGVNFLVATVDVQAGRHRRFVVQVRAGGRNPDDVKRRRKAEIDENRKLDLVFDTDPASDKGGSSAATKRQEPQHTDDQSEE